MWHDSFICVWHGLFTCDFASSICDMTHLHVTWLIYMWHDSFIRDMTRSCRWRDSLQECGSMYVGIACECVMSRWHTHSYWSMWTWRNWSQHTCGHLQLISCAHWVYVDMTHSQLISTYIECMLKSAAFRSIPATSHVLHCILNSLVNASCRTCISTNAHAAIAIFSQWMSHDLIHPRDMTRGQ